MKVKTTEDWEAFLAVCTTQSFVKAAEELKLSPAVLTKRISRLESQLEVRLFHRTTRSVSVTREGSELLPLARTILEDLREAESFFLKQGRLAGKVRLTAPASFAQRVLAPLLTQFQNQYPEITLELILTDSILNLIEGAIDIAIRIGTFKDSSLIARKLGENQLVLCASPSYLKKHPQIRTESDLKLHALLYLDSHGDSRFIKSGTKISDLAKQSKIQCSDGLTLTEFAVHGNGIALRSTWDVQSLIQSGKLKPVLEQEPLEPAGEIMLIVPSRRYLSPRVRALMDFISEKKVFKT